MRITVTGASGLLGSSVARALVAAGHEVTTLQRRPSGVDGATDVLGSVTDAAAVGKAVDRAAFLTISTGLRACLVDPENNAMDAAKLEKLFLSLA